MKKKKISLILIISLLVICIPLTLGGAVYVYYSSSDEKEVDKRLLQNGKLMFYEYGNLLGTYECDNPDDYCGWAYEYIDDTWFSLDYYDDKKIDKFNIINSKYAFLIDTDTKEDEYFKNNDVILYDIINEKVIDKYKAVKNYTIGLENDYYIVKNDEDKWGVIKLDDEVKVVINFQYDYIGVQNEVNSASNKLIADSFVVCKDKTWYMVDMVGSPVSLSFNNEIVRYNNSLLILKNRESSLIYLYTYSGDSILLDKNYKDMKFFGKCIGVIDEYGMFSLLDYDTKEVLTKSSYKVDDMDLVKLKVVEDGTINLYIDGNFAETVK